MCDYFAAPLGVGSIVMSMFTVCMSVCLHTSGQEFLCMLPVVMAQSSSDDNAIRYVLMFLWMTLCLPIFGQAKMISVGRILSDSVGAEPGGEVSCL